MPGVTPNWGLPYPCSGETIDCLIFEQFAEAVQTTLSDMNIFADTALNRPAASVNNGTQTVAVNTSTNAIYATEEYDNFNMVDLAVNNDRITIQADGIYMVNTWSSLGSGFTTITSNAVAITKNGTVFYRKKNSSNTDLTMDVNVTGLLSCVAGDIIRASLLWTGTGGPINTFDTRLSARLVALP